MPDRQNILDITNPDVGAQLDMTGSKTLGAVNDAIIVDTNGKSSLGIQLFGAFSGVVSVQVSVDGTNYVAVGGTPLINATSGTYATSITSAGIFQFDCAGFSSVKLIVTTYTSGSPLLSVRATDVDSMVSLDAGIPAGNNTIGGVTIIPSGSTSPSLSRYRIATAASTNAAAIKTSAGQLKSISVFNTSAAAKFIKLYQKASAPTVGTDVPVITVPIAPGVGRDILLNEPGTNFSTGIAIAITGAAADSDTTVTAVNDVVGFILYN